MSCVDTSSTNEMATGGGYCGREEDVNESEWESVDGSILAVVAEVRLPVGLVSMGSTIRVLAPVCNDLLVS